MSSVNNNNKRNDHIYCLKLVGQKKVPFKTLQPRAAWRHGKDDDGLDEDDESFEEDRFPKLCTIDKLDWPRQV